MYSYEPGYNYTLSSPAFYVLDPEGDVLAVVMSQEEAETLVSHLNRG
jgi:hypothetical protein